MNSPTILYADDSSDDVMLLRLASRNVQVSFHLQWVENGEAAIAYLEGSERFADRNAFPEPDLILLDLKMPVKSGFDVLEWLRAQERCKEIPVVIFTSSVQEEDRERALALGAKEFLVKPIGYRALRDLVRAMDALLAAEEAMDFSSLRIATTEGTASLPGENRSAGPG